MYIRCCIKGWFCVLLEGRSGVCRSIRSFAEDRGPRASNDATASCAFPSTIIAFHFLAQEPISPFACFPQTRPHLPSKPFAFGVATCRTCQAWHPTAWIACRQAMDETVHLPNFLALSIGLQDFVVPLILASHCLLQHNCLLNAVCVLCIPEHLQDFLFLERILGPFVRRSAEGIVEDRSGFDGR